MFKTKVVFVLGAGASKEASFPLGTELKQIVADLLDIRFPDGYVQASGDRLITDAIRKHVEMRGERNINPLLTAGWQIRSAMPQALSIDNYLYAHGHDEKVVLCGKLAIARSILLAERESPLYENPNQDKSIDFGSIEKSWYSKFFQLLTANVALAEVDEIFSNVSVISFNYDRSFEHFLVRALANYYTLSAERAAELVKKLKVVHPYGTVGALPWEASKSSISYGSGNHPEFLLQAASGIRTFSESVADNAISDAIVDCLLDAKAVVFLGFAFHQINMQILELSGEPIARAVYATGAGMSEPDCDVVRQDVQQCLRTNSGNIKIESGVTCDQLFQMYWRVFNSL